ncbi:tRNA (adenosine(37)-N6)-threonylcarbamoyltransferase complex dimerization subunit type 1 TsaB [Thalassobaculum fulvum]|uniref:tRNA (Adenosine(37)-N6)-threonylcarbamoyltransferase complex dimerization subunit type 1 TsaB n=1 Tax=Thalassobaculum fulvum TaxID=1633335 RepID=A0A918XMP9_9PROT|nr:tRNA (adenosine(37)-N6)-threonylcarbamoyltransferase complex dimerization subunit type 1 TsaB [Thalassobaculum fulvum]GHD39947.1 tRNA (adenosine(37)-N6)-threonylcarbamoyltransferase complex dimerization subunit type 1 TsaB [Thalassobaculum fulvum]
MTRLLALDCSAGACSVAVSDAGGVLAAAGTAMNRGHAEALMPMVERVMAEAGLGWDRLDAVAATVGPGSFTGVRIGLAAARGIALAAALPTVPVTTLEAVAEAAGAGTAPLLVVLDTKRSDLYGQWFGAGGDALDGPRVATAAALLAARPAGAEGCRLAGDAAPGLLKAAGDAGLDPRLVAGFGPDARAVAAVALRRLASGGAAPLTPLYLRAPDVTPPTAAR